VSEGADRDQAQKQHGTNLTALEDGVVC